MDSLPRTQRFILRPATTIVAAGLLLLVGILAMVYQFGSAHAERRRQITAQANTLAASVTAAISFHDRNAAQEYLRAFMLDPRLDAVAVYDESGRLVASAQRQGSAPISRAGKRGDPLLVVVPARQGTTIVGSVWLRGSALPWMMQLARVSGVALLMVMAVLMLSVLTLSQRMLTRANVRAHRRAEELVEANLKLTAEMEQRSRAEEALRQSQKMEAVGQLSGGIAHDFNNVLMIVKSALMLLEKRLAGSAAAVERFAETAQERIEAGTQDASGSLRVLEDGLALVKEGRSRQGQISHYLETANEGIDKAADLTNRLLAFARRQPLSPESVQLDTLIRGIGSLLEHSLKADIHLGYQLNSHWHVLCDINQMENAVLNLVINARDAMPAGGQITISTADVHVEADEASGRPAADQVQLRVSDTGTGMSEEVRGKALDPFFTTKPVGKGTGLGLSTILGYVLQSNGQLGIDSELGVGTSITIVLPRNLISVPTQVA